MRIEKNVAVAGLMLAMPWAIDADAAVVTASFESFVPFAVYDVDDKNLTSTLPDTQSDDWVIYGNTSTFTAGYTTKLESSSFSALSATSNGGPASPYNQALGGALKLTHDGGYGTVPAAIATSSDFGAGARNNSSSPSLSFTHQVLGSSETVRIILTGLHEGQLSYDITATIVGSGGGYSATDIALPSTKTNGNSNQNGDYGILVLSIADAVQGDELTFTFATDYSAEAAAASQSLPFSPPSIDYGVGIGAANVTVTEAFVPEPGAMVLTLAGAGLLLGKRRKR